MLCALLCAIAAGQAGGKAGTGGEVGKERGVYLNVVATRDDGSDARITAKDLALYDGGTEQNIQSFVPDPGPARIVILVDNSLGLRADVEKLQKATREFAYEIYEGDKVEVIGYDQNAEIISDWTDDAKKIEAALPEFRKRGAAKSICDELRKNRYVLAYTPTSLPLYDARRLLIVPEDGINVRHKMTQ